MEIQESMESGLSEASHSRSRNCQECVISRRSLISVSLAAGSPSCHVYADNRSPAQGPSASNVKSRVFASSTPAESVKACRTLVARISIPPSICCPPCKAAASTRYSGATASADSKSDTWHTGPFQQVTVREAVEYSATVCVGERGVAQVLLCTGCSFFVLFGVPVNAQY
jgi:hypothetical protein